MIVKIIRYLDEKANLKETLIISDVKWVKRKYNESNEQILEIKIKDLDEIVEQPITVQDGENNYPSVVIGIWLMNNEGKTIDRLV